MNSTHAAVWQERPGIAIPAGQYDELVALALSVPGDRTPAAKFLAHELARARVIRRGRRSAHVVQLGSRVTYRDERTGETREVVLVRPPQNTEPTHVSVLTPLGAALLGLSSGQRMSYPMPDGTTGEVSVLGVVNIL